MTTTPHPTPAAVARYEGLLFSFAEMEREIENMRLLVKKFVTRASYERIIYDWQQQLSNFKHRPPGSVLGWNIPEDSPIQTIVSNGNYEPLGRKGRNVFGRVSGVWDIRIPDAVGKKKGSTQKTFVLLGLASTKITIWAHHDDKEPEEIARWTVEVGDAVSPGCHFHTQITLDDVDNKFPQYLSVPRLPGFLHTPMDSLEFLLAELFQEAWYEHTSRGSDYLNNWATCQRNRFRKLLEWQLEKIKDTSGSPWTTFKRQKPPLNLFFGESAR
jgi:hypothetical protein